MGPSGPLFYMKRLVEYDPFSGISTYVKQEDNVTHVIEEQDVEAILECNKQIANDPEIKNKGIKRGWMHLATIPNNIIHKMMIETGLDPFTKEGIQYLTKMVHQREFKHLKVANGRYIRAPR